jgi:uncharacterized protein YfbU (UPF0304 family)
MAAVTIRLDDDTREELEEIARTRGVTLSVLLRDQIDALLGRQVPMRDDAPHALSFQQRQLLAQQSEILALLQTDKSEAQHHHSMAEVLREGYAGEYDKVFGGMPSEMSRSECKLLWDILDMFRVLSTSIDRLSADDRAALGDRDEERLRFAGFDLNDSREGRLLGYVRHLVDTDRWTEIKPRLAEIGDGGNSHSRCLPAYERMLAAYTLIFEDNAKGERGHSMDSWLFNINELRQVAETWAWPGRRMRELSGAEVTARQSSGMHPGSAEFRAAIATLPPARRDALNLLADWAETLEREGLVRLFTARGNSDTTLRPYLLAKDAGLVSIVCGPRSSFMQFWPSVFQRRAPHSIPAVEAALGAELKQGISTHEFPEPLLDALTLAYRETAD